MVAEHNFSKDHLTARLNNRIHSSYKHVRHKLQYVFLFSQSQTMDVWMSTFWPRLPAGSFTEIARENFPIFFKRGKMPFGNYKVEGPQAQARKKNELPGTEGFLKSSVFRSSF